ncbi:glycosyltransferase family 4 protein [Sellimonas catena]|uniref:Glycosyltransferase EpsD n=1 Tax=Sellimonas catena TaxID=2994035 RepID=A0A9W6CBE3_9FIRM|nr:glycosyltransferase family 4 protein [Sellimonas catena]GLG06122.1 putative glycosyltransferase EpsD [Sellimonas catena]
MKRMLMLASVASMIDQFNMPNIELLQEMGYEVHVACNFEKGSTCTDEKVLELKKKLKQLHVRFFQIDFERNVMKLNQDLKAYKQVLKLARKYQYTFIHCHSPIGGVVGRLVGHKTNTKVIYTAHGFHFYKGAPVQNWLIYYPIEKFLSRYTDILITINKEDYQRAKKKFDAKKVEYVPGVGINIKKFQDIKIDRERKRRELGIKTEDTVLISVGELNKNKNHEVIIKALAKLQRPDIQYLLVGKGSLKEYLAEMAKNLGVGEQVHFLGFRNDVAELYKTADIFVFPSKREGLPVALMEAMTCGIASIASGVRGNTDLIKNEFNGILTSPNRSEDYEKAIIRLANNKQVRKKMGEENSKIIQKYSSDNINKIIKNIYSNIKES